MFKAEAFLYGKSEYEYDLDISHCQVSVDDELVAGLSLNSRIVIVVDRQLLVQVIVRIQSTSFNEPFGLLSN